MKIVFRWIACILAIYISDIILNSVDIENLYVLIGAGTVLWLVNLTIRPILKILSFPITFATLGLFSFVINVLMVALTDFLVPEFSIDGFLPYIFIAILISVITSILNNIKKK